MSRLYYVYERSVIALQYARERNEINLTRLIRGQRDSKILLRQGNQRIAIENRGFVGELRGAEQVRNRGGGLNLYEVEIRARGLKVVPRARYVLILREPKEDRHVETDETDPVALLIRLRGDARNQVIIVLDRHGKIRKILHLRDVQRA